MVNSGTAPKNGPQNLRYRCPTCDGPLKKKRVPPAQENLVMMHQLRGLDNHSTPQTHPTELAMLLSPEIPALAFNTQSPVKVPANSSCICKPVLGRHVFITPVHPAARCSSTGSTLVQIMAYIAIAASFLYRLCRQEIGLRNRMCVCSNVPNLNCGWG